MTVLNLQVAASSDDASEVVAGTVTLTGTTFAAATDGHIGLRFTGVTIPPGATIDTATLQCYFSSTKNDNVQANVYGQAHDNAGTFTTTAYDISSRAKTTAYVWWSNTSSGVGWEVSPDIKTAVQEIVDRAGWASGNALVLLLTGGATTLPYTYDQSAAYGWKLDIAYTTATVVVVGQAAETDTGLASTAVRRYTVGQAAETDTGQAATAARRYTLGQAAETDTGLPLVAVSRDITITVGPPQPKWQARTPAAAWAAGPPTRKWQAGPPST